MAFHASGSEAVAGQSIHLCGHTHALPGVPSANADHSGRLCDVSWAGSTGAQRMTSGDGTRCR